MILISLIIVILGLLASFSKDVKISKFGIFIMCFAFAYSLFLYAGYTGNINKIYIAILFVIGGFISFVQFINALNKSSKLTESNEVKKSDDNFSSTTESKRETFSFRIKNKNDFENIKKSLYSKYAQYGFTEIVIDSDEKYYLSADTEEIKGYIELSLDLKDCLCRVTVFGLSDKFNKSIFDKYVLEKKASVVVNEQQDFNSINQLIKLAELREKGLLSEKEFNSQKAKLINT